MAQLNIRLYWTLISLLFSAQYILSFFINQSGTYVISILLNGVVPNLKEHGYLDCQYFKVLFCYTRIILPIFHALPIIVWFYSNVLLGYNSFAQNEFVLAITPIFSNLFSPYVSLSSRFDDQYIDKLCKRSIIIQTIYITPSFLIYLCILCTQSCLSDDVTYPYHGSFSTPGFSTKLVLLSLLICTIFYILVIQYVSLRYFTRKITTIYHDYFISLSVVTELLLLIMALFHIFYAVNPADDGGFDAKAAVFYVISVPLIFPAVYYHYYYKKLNPLKLKIFYHVKHGINQHHDSQLQRAYSFIHIMCHQKNSYDITLEIDCKADDSKQVPLMLDNNANEDSHQRISEYIHHENHKRQSMDWQNGIIRHQDDSLLCLQYQHYFMRLSFAEQIKYISEVTPYRSRFFRSKDSVKCCKLQCNNRSVCCTYFILILKFLGSIAPLFWFGFVYLYQCNGDDIHKYGLNQWLVYRGDNKYEHFVIAILYSVYFVITLFWMFCAGVIFSMEYYYGFVRLLLLNSDDESISDHVAEFHQSMVRNDAIVRSLESCDIISIIAIQIVSYLPDSDK